LRKEYFVGLTPENEGAVTAFDDGDFATREESVHRRFVDRILLLELIDGVAASAASGRPMMGTPRGVTHCAYT
jgi:hypothetical protein